MAYNRTYYYNVQSQAGLTYRIEFYDKIANATFQNIPGTPGKNPFKVKWGTDGSSMFAPLKPSTCTLNFMVTDFKSAMYVKQLRTERQEQDVYVAIFRETVVGSNAPIYNPIWGGFLLMDLSDDPDQATPYNVTLKAVDGIAALKYYDYVPATTSQRPDNLYDLNDTFMPSGGVGQNNNPIWRTFKQIIADCFAYLGEFNSSNGNTNDPMMRLAVSWMNGAFSATTVEPLSNTRVKPDIFYTTEEVTDDITKYKPKTCYDVLKAVCKGWGMRLFYWRNTYYFIQISEFNNTQTGTQASPNDIRNYKFKLDGTTIGSSNTIQGFWGTYQLYMDSNIHNGQIKWRKKSGGQYGILPAFKKVTVDFMNVDNNNLFQGFPPIPPSPGGTAIGNQYTFNHLCVITCDGITDQYFFNRIYLDVINNSGYPGKIEVNWGLWARPYNNTNTNNLNVSAPNNDWMYYLCPDPLNANSMVWKIHWNYQWGGQPYADQFTIPPGNSTIEITDSPAYSTIPQFPYCPAPTGVLQPFTAGDWELGYYVDAFCTTLISGGVTYNQGAWQMGGQFNRTPANAGGLSSTLRSPHFWNVSWQNVQAQQGIGASEFAPIVNGSVGSASTSTSLVQTGDDTAFQNIKDILFGDTGINGSEGGVQVYDGSGNWVLSDISGLWGIDTLSGTNSMSQQLATDIISAQSTPIHKFTVQTILDPEEGVYFNDGTANRPQYPFPGTKWLTLSHTPTGTPARKWIMHTCEFDIVNDTWKWVLYQQQLKDTDVTTTTTTTGGWNSGHTGGWDIPHDDDVIHSARLGNPAGDNAKQIRNLIFEQPKPLTTITGDGYRLPFTGWDGTGEMPGPASQTITSLTVDKIENAVLKVGDKINVLIRNLRNEAQFTPAPSNDYTLQAQYPYCLTFTVNADQSANATSISVESKVIYQDIEPGARVLIDPEYQTQQNHDKTQGTVGGFTIDSDSIAKDGVDIKGFTDSDTMEGSDLNQKLPTTESVKAYADTKQKAITLTTEGTSGAATFNSGTGALNIPNYETSGGSATSNYKYYSCTSTTVTSATTGESNAVIIPFNTREVASTSSNITFIDGSVIAPTGTAIGMFTMGTGTYQIIWNVGTNTNLVNNRILTGVKLQKGTLLEGEISFSDIDHTHAYIYDRGNGAVRKGSTSGSLMIRHTNPTEGTIYYRLVIWKEAASNASMNSITLLNATSIQVIQQQ